MTMRSRALLALSGGLLVVLSRGKKALQLTGSRDPGTLVNGWTPAQVAGVRRSLWLDLVAFIPLYTATGASLRADSGGGRLPNLGLAVLVGGAVADVVEDGAALAYLAGRSATVVGPMHWGSRLKLVVFPSLVGLALLARRR